MDADTLKFLYERAVAAGPRVIDLPDEPDGTYGIVQGNGTLEVCEAKRPTIKNDANDIDTLCRVAASIAAEARPEIWYSRNGVTAVFNSGTPYSDRCELRLTPSPQLALLQKWDQAGAALLTQAEFVTLLRTMFAGIAPADLLPVIRKVTAARGAQINQQIEQGKVSMRREIVAEMTGASAVPEQVTLFVPMFAQAACQDCEFVKIDIDPIADTEKFRLTVIPGDIEKALAAAEEALFRKIAEALGDSCAIAVYRGKP